MYISNLRIIRYLCAIFIIFTLNFIIPRAMPGDPVLNLLGEDFIVSQRSVDEIRKEIGLDKPVFIQYLNYWNDIFHLDLGRSYRLNSGVAHIIFSRLKWTLALMLPAVLIGSLTGTVLGAFAGWDHTCLPNKLLTLTALSVYSCPPFFFSLIILYVFSFKLGMFPIKGFYTTGTIADIIHHLALPALIIILISASGHYMIMRGSVLQEKTKTYILFAKAKGLSGKRILFGHIFKNAFLPVLTSIAIEFGFMFSGVLFIEIVFSLNGMGTLIFDAIVSRDYPVLQGSFLVITMMIIFSNLCADFLYGYLDPRVRCRY